jgi:hypothetical protein
MARDAPDRHRGRSFFDRRYGLAPHSPDNGRSVWSFCVAGLKEGYLESAKPLGRILPIDGRLRPSPNAVFIRHQPVSSIYTASLLHRARTISSASANDLNTERHEELIDNYSEPPSGSNVFHPWPSRSAIRSCAARTPDLLLKIYRIMFDLFQGIGRFIEAQSPNTRSRRLPFMSLCIDPVRSIASSNDLIPVRRHTPT